MGGGEREESKERRRRGGRNQSLSYSILLPDCFLFFLSINDDDNVDSLKVLRPVPHSGYDIHRTLILSPLRLPQPSPVPKGSCNSLWSKYQDLQCVEDCDTDHPVFYEQPVWQTLQMFGRSLPFHLLRSPLTNYVLQPVKCYASITTPSRAVLG